MKNNNTFENIIDSYTNNLMELLQKRFTSSERSYGFEYEFISKEPLSMEHIQEVYDLLPQCGFSSDGTQFTSDSGMYITIEPGGQIEYCSPPVLRAGDQQFHDLVELIAQTNKKIKESLNINYIGKGYIPGRGNAPMVLKADRYHNLHARMLKTGTRGREMMKGTASIHLHARILDMDDMVPLFGKFLELSMSDEFKMSSDRRDIWKNTDPVRCGQPVKDLRGINGPEVLLHEIVRFAMNAEDIGENVPFPGKKDTSFDAFLYHITTLFTDVRLNMKGPTWELRTLDSRPIPEFEQKWKKFTHSIENMNEVI